MANTNTINGVAQGASAGAAFGPWGAVIGGVIGGLVGLSADDKAKEAKRLLKKANRLRTDATMLRSFAEQRLLLRQAQLAQAQATAASAASGADLDSSGAQGLRNSVRNQMFDNFLLGQSILNEQLDANVYENKAKAKLGQAQDAMGLLAFGTQLVGLIPQGNKDNPKSTTYGPDSGNGMTAPSLQNAFDTTLVNPGGLQTTNTNGLA